MLQLQYNRRKKYDAKLYHPDFFVLRHLNEFINNKLEYLISCGRHIGDIGCGEQPLRHKIETLEGVYTGIDIAQNSENSVDVIASIDNVPLSDNLFDVVICTEVLEHIFDINGAFKEMARLTKHGGKILITTPFTYPLHEEPFDYIRLTPHMLNHCATKYGLKIIESKTCGNELEVIATIWGNLWERMSTNKSFIIKIMNALMNTPVNLIVAGLSRLFDGALPKKYYLNFACILLKE